MIHLYQIVDVCGYCAGYNVCIFAYGQTGSGKTHTMSGSDVVNYSGRGINYRALDDLFQIKEERSDEVRTWQSLWYRPSCSNIHFVLCIITSLEEVLICVSNVVQVDYDIKVTMLEIYNEALRDLLSEGGKVNKVDIRCTEKSGLNVPDAVQRSVTSTEDVLEVMETGSNNRAVGGTKMNSRSSRSHSVLTVVVTGTNNVTGMRTHGCLHLVDLAGSERVGRTEASGIVDLLLWHLFPGYLFLSWMSPLFDWLVAPMWKKVLLNFLKWWYIMGIVVDASLLGDWVNHSF